MRTGNVTLLTKVPLRDENQLDKGTNFIGISFSCHSLYSLLNVKMTKDRTYVIFAVDL